MRRGFWRQTWNFVSNRHLHQLWCAATLPYVPQLLALADIFQIKSGASIWRGRNLFRPRDPLTEHFAVQSFYCRGHVKQMYGCVCARARGQSRFMMVILISTDTVGRCEPWQFKFLILLLISERDIRIPKIFYLLKRFLTFNFSHFWKGWWSWSVKATERKSKTNRFLKLATGGNKSRFNFN